MKLQIVIVAALIAVAMAAEPRGEGAPEKDAMVDEHVDRAIKTTTDAVAATRKAIADEKAACEAEIKGSQDWMDAIDENKLKAMRARRIKDKQNLLEAVKERITVMKDYLGKLKVAREKLSGVITHVNTIYGNAYDEAVAAQKESARIMMLLGLSIGHTYNPGSEFSKIKLPRQDKEDGEGSAEEDAKAIEEADKKVSNKKIKCKDCFEEDEVTTTLMELEASVHEKVSRCKNEFCEAAYHYAFDIYKNGHTNAKQDFADFNVDKKIIVFFRTTVTKLITRKEGRLANLTKQSDELEKSLAEAEGSDKGPLMQIIDMIADHKQRITASCGVMKGRSLEMIAELEALRNCAEGKECSASDAKTAEVKSDSESNDAAAKLEKESQSTSTGSASGATGAATGAATASAETKDTVDGVFDETTNVKAPAEVKESSF